MRTHGTLVKWKDDRGFGFILESAGREEIFVHVSAFPRDGRRPEVGELVSFETQAGPDGKRKAIRVQRPGGRPAEATRRRAGESPAAKSGGLLRSLLALAAIAAIVAVTYDQWLAPGSAPASVMPASAVAGPATAGSEVFQCDGRIHCSQMRSCAEARFFLKNCPGTRMDGNHDGEPCEQQLCN